MGKYLISLMGIVFTGSLRDLTLRSFYVSILTWVEEMWMIQIREFQAVLLDPNLISAL